MFWFWSDPLVTRGLDFGVDRHVDQTYHLEPAPSTDTRAMTGATLADHRTTVATVDFFIGFPPSKGNQQRTGLLIAMRGQQTVTLPWF
jgi:hypothetical protein